MSRTTETIEWIPIEDYLPDEDSTVLIRAVVFVGEPVWFGYLDAGRWRYVDGKLANDVTHWAEMLEGPKG